MAVAYIEDWRECVAMHEMVGFLSDAFDARVCERNVALQVWAR